MASVDGLLARPYQNNDSRARNDIASRINFLAIYPVGPVLRLDVSQSIRLTDTDRASLFQWRVYEKRSFVSIEFWPQNWGVVSVMMEGVYRIGQSSG
jgi:hypothetical protein